MKATEVRIGNYYDEFGNVRQVNWTTLGALAGEGKEELWFKPVPLTEEWLLKFGFKKWGRNDLPRTLSYEYGKIQIFPSNPFCDFIGYGFMHYKPNKNESTESARFKFQYVHQLQNLYFALTGEELTLTKNESENS
jgi:hypothetical protein